MGAHSMDCKVTEITFDEINSSCAIIEATFRVE